MSEKSGAKRNIGPRSFNAHDNYHCLAAIAQVKENLTTDYICMAMRGRETCLAPLRTEYGKKVRKDYDTEKVSKNRKNIQQLEPRSDGKTNCLTSVQKDNLIWVSLKSRCPFDETGKTMDSIGNQPTMPTLCMSCGYIRRLTPTECARLQTIPEWYVWKCNDTQQYRMLGNGWTVEVIVHIFSFLNMAS